MSKFGAMRNQRAAAPKAEAAPTANENQSSPKEVEPRPAGNPSVQGRTRSREGTKLVGAHYPPEVSRALKMLAAEQDKDMQSMLGEAIDDLLRKYGKHSVGLSS